MMTPTDFAAIRERAGLSQAALAARLRLGDGRTVRRYELAERPIPGPVSLLMELLDAGRLAAPRAGKGKPK